MAKQETMLAKSKSFKAWDGKYLVPSSYKADPQLMIYDAEQWKELKKSLLKPQSLDKP